MKFDIKKLYKSTIKTLEAHSVELSIALTAISLLAFVPESEKEAQAHAELKAIYQSQIDLTNHQITVLKELVASRDNLEDSAV